MVCKVCGRTIGNENANFCEYCGAALNGRGDGYGAGGYSGYSYGNGNQSSYAGSADASNNYYGNAAYTRTPDNSLTAILNGTAGTAEAEGSISFLHWIVILLLPYIPIVGTFAYLILLFVWSFGKTATTTRKNWARATLVMLVVAIMVMSYALGGMLADGSLMDIMNSLGTP